MPAFGQLLQLPPRHAGRVAPTSRILVYLGTVDKKRSPETSTFQLRSHERIVLRQSVIKRVRDGTRLVAFVSGNIHFLSNGMNRARQDERKIKKNYYQSFHNNRINSSAGEAGYGRSRLRIWTPEPEHMGAREP